MVAGTVGKTSITFHFRGKTQLLKLKAKKQAAVQKKGAQGGVAGQEGREGCQEGRQRLLLHRDTLYRGEV